MPGTELGKAYVQIVPSAKGIQGSLAKELGGPGEEAGKHTGAKIGTCIKNAIIAAGIGTAIKAAVSEGAKLEQSFGGLDTIYGAAADEAKRYAAEAAKAGISANDYAEQAVSFGASLKQAFGGDTARAVEAANTAIMDMTDNAAKMGTPIESIQNAYAGFAKQNYTMLDNLKLGYGGTKSEMERLLADAQKLSGVEYNIDNLGDVYDAIHVIQDELGLAGMAAEEASTTLSGSLGAMKAALSNTLGNLALGKSIGPSLSVLSKTVVAFLTNNLIPMIKNVLMALPELATALAEQAPMLLMALSQSLIDALPVLIPAVIGAVFTIAQKLTEPETLMTLVNAVLQIIGAIVVGIVNSLPRILGGIGQVIDNAINFIYEAISPVIDGIAGIFTDAWNGIEAAFSSAGDFFSGVWRSIQNAFGSVTEWFRGVFSRAWQAVKNVFSSGGRIFTGIKEGIERAFKNVVNAIIRGINRVVAIPFNAINGFLNTLRGVDILGIRPFGWIRTINVPQIPQLAKGGIVGEPTILEAGEAGDEAIVPLDKLWREMRTMWADTINGNGNSVGVGNMTVNVYAADGQSAEDIADAVMDRIQAAVERREAVFA